MKKYTEMITLTNGEEIHFKTTTSCHIKSIFHVMDSKLKIIAIKEISIAVRHTRNKTSISKPFFHNLSDYDIHFL